VTGDKYDTGTHSENKYTAYSLKRNLQLSVCKQNGDSDKTSAD